ncbi:hypothetical protein V1283_002386 [Bradyrhizobium sp. AZCC 2262]|uniref:hypothetical protein n=1 Tax=Bradyrhizobium sp. AZCC 2262 TaxID=3117022 RepID=UPI002FF303A9
MRSLQSVHAASRLAILSVAMLLAPEAAFAAERLSGTNIDKRTTVAFRASDAVIGKLMPKGWVSNPIATGPLKGANATVVLIDSYFASDADEKPRPPFSGFVLALPARKQETEIAGNLIVFGITTKEQAPGAYAVYVSGKAAIERTSKLSNGEMIIRENWQLTSDDGNELQVNVQFKRSLASRSKTDARTRSGTNPDYYRIYRVDQATEIVRSAAESVDRAEAFIFRASGPKLTEIFDGTEQLVGIISTPVYSRTVSLPD